MSLLEVEHLKKTFGDFVAVDDVSFQVNAGEVFGLLGPNGAGKSTTMNMICGLLEPSAGALRIDGKPISFTDRSSRISLGMVPQDLAIYPELTGFENLDFFGKLYGITGAELSKRVENALERVGLSARAKDLAGHYSGGMKRRLNFAVALLHQPKLLILDEPTVGVDPQSRFHLLDCIRDLHHNGVAAIYCSHYMEEVQTLCKRVAIIDHGKMLACDSIDNLLGQLDSHISLSLKNVTSQLKTALLQQSGISLLDEKELDEKQKAETNETTFVLSGHQQKESSLNHQLAVVLQQIEQAGVNIVSIETNAPNLERLFLKLTGHTLRD